MYISRKLSWIHVEQLPLFILGNFNSSRLNFRQIPINIYMVFHRLFTTACPVRPVLIECNAEWFNVAEGMCKKPVLVNNLPKQNWFSIESVSVLVLSR